MTTIQQHRYEVWASTLLVLTLGMSLVSNYLLGCGYFAPHHTTAQLLTLYAATPLLLVICYYIRQGNRGAKTLLLTLYAFVLLQLLSGRLAPTAYDTPLKLGSLVVQHGLQVLACALLLLSLRTPVDAGAVAGDESVNRLPAAGRV